MLSRLGSLVPMTVCVFMFSNGCTPSAQVTQRTLTPQVKHTLIPWAFVKGVDFKELITHIDATNQDILSIYSRTGMGGRKIGDVIPMAGTCEVTWRSTDDQIYRIRGTGYVAIRKDSPNTYDFAIVPENPSEIPTAALERKAQQLGINKDSEFISGEHSEISRNAAWICKLGKRPGNDPIMMKDW